MKSVFLLFALFPILSLAADPRMPVRQPVEIKPVGSTSAAPAANATAPTRAPQPAPAPIPNLSAPAPAVGAPPPAASANPAPFSNPNPNSTPVLIQTIRPAGAPPAKLNTSVPSQLMGGAVDYKKFRDPFKEPDVSEELQSKSDLEKYSVTDFKVTGIVTGPLRMRAMVVAPDGKTHYVSEKMKMGTRDGVVVKITTKTLVVREKVLNPLGEVELFETEIGMDHKGTEQ